MPVVSDKYRGTTKYFHVHAELVRAAQYQGRTTYQDIALLMGLPQSGNYSALLAETAIGLPSTTAHALDVCKTENSTRDTTHGGAPLTAPVTVCRKRPFTTHN